MDADGTTSSYSGIVSFENGVATLGDAGSATYTFSVSSAGTYDIAIRLCYPFWDKNGIYVSIDGNTTHFTESRLWWPYWRSTFWTTLASNMSRRSGYAHRIILKPYVDALKNTSSDDSLRRIQEIQTLLAQNTEKRETLTKLMTQGIIDPILFNKETNELLSQADSFRDEINALKNAVSGDVTKVTAATVLLHFTEKGGILQKFDDDLFKEYVNRIVVRSRNEVCFELKCGLTLRERM